MPVRIFNTLSREKEVFQPLNPPKVTFYSCGPTVYGEFHIGNARTFVTADVIRRWLLQRGYEVTYAQNITDVDDKIIDRAKKEGVSATEIAEKYTAYFLKRLQILGNLPADHHPKATQHIGGMIGLIKKLEAKGHAYASEDGSVWFDVNSFPEYGKLSRMPMDQIQQGERLDGDQQKLKKSPTDFALWKAAKPGEPAWKSPWGEGRPGWHIECSCMSMGVLKSETIDIHTGGVDLRFPHHENEIAQSEGATGKPFVRFWIHQGMLDIEGLKMSKSIGNVKMIDDVLAVIDPLTLRYFLISARYRDKLDLTDDNIHKCQSAVDRMIFAGRESKKILAVYTGESDWKDSEELNALWEEFGEAMDDDFNTPRGLGALSKTTTKVNWLTAEVQKDEGLMKELAQASALLAAMRSALGLGPELEKEDRELSEETLEKLSLLAREWGVESPVVAEALMASIIERRARARKEKDFALSDAIRDTLKDLGLALEDKPGETLWKKL